MIYPVQVLVEVDDVNKIYYTEDKYLDLNDKKAIELATAEYYNLILSAKKNGYIIIKREKNVSPIDDGLMATIDEKIDELGGPSF